MSRRYPLPEVCDTREEAEAFYAAVDAHEDELELLRQDARAEQ